MAAIGHAGHDTLLRRHRKTGRSRPCLSQCNISGGARSGRLADRIGRVLNPHGDNHNSGS
jgi:hypothetical protein